MMTAIYRLRKHRYAAISFDSYYMLESLIMYGNTHRQSYEDAYVELVQCTCTSVVLCCFVFLLCCVALPEHLMDD